VFFFQAEDGIRDWSVTGVQTCALPILLSVSAGTRGDREQRPLVRDSHGSCVVRVQARRLERPRVAAVATEPEALRAGDHHGLWRSEERRVGKESRSRWGAGA